jgi:hypothetical protein
LENKKKIQSDGKFENLNLESSQFSYGSKKMKHRWKDNDRGNPMALEKNLSQCGHVYHKSHRNWPTIETGQRWWNAKTTA